MIEMFKLRINCQSAFDDSSFGIGDGLSRLFHVLIELLLVMVSVEPFLSK